eukprot:17084_5
MVDVSSSFCVCRERHLDLNSSSSWSETAARDDNCSSRLFIFNSDEMVDLKSSNSLVRCSSFCLSSNSFFLRACSAFSLASSSSLARALASSARRSSSSNRKRSASLSFRIFSSSSMRLF